MLFYEYTRQYFVLLNKSKIQLAERIKLYDFLKLIISNIDELDIKVK